MFREIECRLEPGELTEKEICREMGYGDTVPEQEIMDIVREVIEDAGKICRMRCIYRVLDAEMLSRRDVRIGDTVFSPGGIITSYLDGMTSACLFIATAGEEFNRYIKGREILSQFVADSAGSVIAEKAVDRVAAALEKEFPGLPHSLPYSPGYCAWNITQQKMLFPMFPPKPCGVILSDSCLMFPEKSVSGFFAMGAGLIPQPYRCDVCTYAACYKRRVKA